jgi:hypothetical protein
MILEKLVVPHLVKKYSTFMESEVLGVKVSFVSDFICEVVIQDE